MKESIIKVYINLVSVGRKELKDVPVDLRDEVEKRLGEIDGQN